MVKHILTCKAAGILLFFGIMALVFHLTFNVAGEALRQLLARGIDALSAASNHILNLLEAPLLLHSLIIEGIFPGVGSVLSFVPIIGVLFFFLSLMEESGYLSYVATLMDQPARRIDLTGRAVIPLIAGFGCNVPAIMTAGSLLEGREKTTVITMMPFMSCSARLPIYAMFIAAFFEEYRLPVLGAVYGAGIIAAILIAILLKRLPGGSNVLLTETKSCSLLKRSIGDNAPVAHVFRNKLFSIFRTALYTAWQNCLGFIKKACTVILLASAIIWFLRTFGAGLHPVNDIGDSLLAVFGRAAAPIFTPLGFDDWRAASALIGGLFAKETIISTLTMLSSSGGSSVVYAAIFSGGSSSLLTEAFTPLSSFCFMVFCLLYIPCIPTLAAVRQETGSIRFCITLCLFQLITAWAVSFLLFHVGGFIMQL